MIEIIMIKSGGECPACETMWGKINHRFSGKNGYSIRSEYYTTIPVSWRSACTAFPTTFVLKNNRILDGNPIRGYPGKNFDKEFNKILGGKYEK